ncbi:MAG: aldo/keto reductase [Spirochaetales bacterium]|nr:aldo/keto reductase [Spirochaetales bacterium]
MAVTYKRLGKHGVLVSSLCLGTMNFGWHTTEEESFRIMDRALDLGINFFDTADVYGWEVDHGHTEEIIGRWLGRGGGRRNSIVLATKVYNPANKKSERYEPNHSERNLSALKIARHCEASLKRLNTDVIDLYQMHHIDRDCPWDETWNAFDKLQTQGKIIYAGSSNFAGWQIATACQEASRRGLTGPVSEQSKYNLNCRMVELEVIPACSAYGLGFIPYSPVDGGMLAGFLDKIGKGRRSGEWITDRIASEKEKIKKYEDFCKTLGHPPAEVALAWLLHQPGVTSPIIGPRTIEHLETAVRATEIPLDESALKVLDEIFPGPGGRAPEAYAW